MQPTGRTAASLNISLLHGDFSTSERWNQLQFKPFCTNLRSKRVVLLWKCCTAGDFTWADYAPKTPGLRIKMHGGAQPLGSGAGKPTWLPARWSRAAHESPLSSLPDHLLALLFIYLHGCRDHPAFPVACLSRPHRPQNLNEPGGRAWTQDSSFDR